MRLAVQDTSGLLTLFQTKSGLHPGLAHDELCVA